MKKGTIRPDSHLIGFDLIRPKPTEIIAETIAMSNAIVPNDRDSIDAIICFIVFSF